MKKGIITTLHRANDTSDSLRTTVPISIIKQFDLNVGDKLSWRFLPKYNKLVVEVQPIHEGVPIGNSIGNEGGGE